MSTVMTHLLKGPSPELVRAVGALALGLLLGALVAVPYGRAAGLSSLPYGPYLYTALQSLVATATLVRVRAIDQIALEVDVEALPSVSLHV